MTQWLAPIVGVVVIGVVIELLTKESRLGQFIRAIYTFFILYVVVQPLPQLLHQLTGWHATEPLAVNAKVLTDLTAINQQVQVTQLLKNLGYTEALVVVQGNSIYINSGAVLTDSERESLQKQVAEQVAEEVTIYLI